MGYYINPRSQSKEEWLAENGAIRSLDDCKLCFSPERTGKEYPVVLIDNGWMTAAGIAFELRELEAFTEPRDARPKTLFVVPKEKILEVCPEVERALT